MNWSQHGFEQVGKGAGEVSMGFGDEIQTFPYEATFYLNSDGTVAADEGFDPNTKETSSLFFSKTSAGDLLTFTSHQSSCVEVEGVRLNTVGSTETEALLNAHMEALADQAMAEPEALKEEVKGIRQRAADLSMKLLAQMMEAFNA